LAVFKRRVGPGCRRESSQLILHDNACVRSPAPSMLAVLITLLLLFPQGNAVRVYFCASSVRRSNRPDHPGWQLEVSGPSIILLSARNWMLFLISVLDTKWQAVTCDWHIRCATGRLQTLCSSPRSGFHMWLVTISSFTLPRPVGCLFAPCWALFGCLKDSIRALVPTYSLILAHATFSHPGWSCCLGRCWSRQGCKPGDPESRQCER
jgi:hypothetical protein